MAVPGTALPDPQMIILATRLQAHFVTNGLSLADPAVAHAFRVSMEAARLIVDSVHGAGRMPDGAHEVVEDMLTAAMLVPDVL